MVLAAESDFDPAGEEDETGMQYKLSPPDARGHWFLVVAHTPPSCHRKHNVLRYKALRPGVNGNQTVVLIANREKINSFF
jgi:hypothetical protein